MIYLNEGREHDIFVLTAAGRIIKLYADIFFDGVMSDQLIIATRTSRETSG